MTVATPSPLPLDSRAKTPPWMVAWGYFQHELLYLTWLLMEAALLTPLLVLLVRWIRLWPAALLLLWLLLLMALSLNLARLMGLLTISLSRQRAVMVVTFLFVYLLTIRNLFYQPASLRDLAWLGQFGRNLADFSNINWLRDSGWFFLVLFLWWRGLRLAGKTFSVHHAGIRLRVGGLILAPLLIVWSSNHLPWRVFPFILLFFLAALTAVALVRAEEIEKAQSGRSALLHPRWLLVVLLAAIGVVGTAVFLTLVATGHTSLLLIGWLAPVWLAVTSGGAVVVTTVLVLLSPLLNLLSGGTHLLAQLLVWLMNQFGGAVTLSTPQPDSSVFMPEATREIMTNPALAGGSKLITVLLMVALALAVSLALNRVYRRAQFNERKSDWTESAAGAAANKLNFRDKLRQGWQRLRGWRTAASIRHLYQNMCRAAAASGYARQPAETPFEYQSTLDHAWPEHQADTRLITAAYVKIRYGELPETAVELEWLRQAWRRLEAAPPTPEQNAKKTVIVQKRDEN